MGKFVRVRSNRFDVRHEYLQADGSWKQAKCGPEGFCRECNVRGAPVPEGGVRPAGEARDHVR
ncbi:hypothetical protein LWE61_15200 [Sphingobium sufflavum]|nr:hypothetical protein [Sphingobium sufflavum]